jgi:hypothetical protein
VVLVRDELEVEVGSETTLVAVGVGKGKVGVLRVGRDGEDLNVEPLELGELLVEGEDLGGADEGDCDAKRAGRGDNRSANKVFGRKGGKGEGNVQSRG